MKYKTPMSGLYLASEDRLYRYFKGRLTRSQIRDFLQREESYTRFRDRKRKFPRNSYFRGHPQYMVQGDLMEIPGLSDSGYRYLFVLINVFTRVMRVFPLKDKTSSEVCTAMEKYLTTVPPFTYFCSDRGTEFTSKQNRQCRISSKEHQPIRLLHSIG